MDGARARAQSGRDRGCGAGLLAIDDAFMDTVRVHVADDELVGVAPMTEASHAVPRPDGA